MKEKLENSIPLNSTFEKCEISNTEILSHLWRIIYPNKKYRLDSKQDRHLRILLVKLYTCHQSKYDYIGYSRNSNDYKPESAYNVLGLSYKILIHLVDTMKDNGYIIHHTGYFDRDTKCGKSSRMKASDSLIELIDSLPETMAKIDNEILSARHGSYITLKDANKKFVEYYETDLTKEWNDLMISYNKLIAKSRLRVSVDTDSTINYDNITVRRVFNDDSFGLGGRYYGGWWQNIKRGYRRHITINGDSSVEIDYKSFHLVLAYSMVGIDYFVEIDDDPYLIDHEGLGEEYRDLVKKVTLTAFNSQSRDKAIKSIHSEINKGEIKRHPSIKISQIISLCEKKHHRIADMFYSDVGKLLQYNDSMVAQNIIKYFTEKNILILCVHDSFLCQNQYKEELKDYMENVILNTYGVKVFTKVIQS